VSSTDQAGTPGTAVGGSRPDVSPPSSASSAAAPTAPTPTNASATTTHTPPVDPRGGAQGTNPQTRAQAAGRAPQRSGQPRPQNRGGQPPRQGQRRATTRRVKLAVARVDPWSVMKLAFLLAVAAGIAGVVLTGVLWLILSGMGVFSDIDRVVREIQPSTTTPFNLMSYIGFGRVISLAIVLGVIDIILMTALATLSAFLYNICSALVGGLQLTLTDD
jgi:hypothetical protein